MTQQIINERSNRDILLKGLKILFRILKLTYGPKGLNILIDTSETNTPDIIKQGFSITKKVYFKEKLKNLPLLLIEDSLGKINQISGDGTTTTFLLTYYLLINSFQILIDNSYCFEVTQGIKISINYLIFLLNEFSEPITELDSLKKLSLSSMAKDEILSDYIHQAFLKIGKSGTITIEENEGNNISLEIEKGMKLRRGYLSSYFVTNFKEMTVDFKNCYLLLTTDTFSFTDKKNLDLFEELLFLKKPLVIVTPEIDEETLSTLILNKINGIFNSVVITIPKTSNFSNIFIEDIARYTNAFIFSSKDNFRSINLSQLGIVKRILISKTTTFLFQDDNFELTKIQNYCNQLRKQKIFTDSVYEKDKIEDRILNLQGSNAILKVGSINDFELNELKTRIKSNLALTKALFYEGMIPGGGLSFLHVAEELENWSKANLKNYELLGSKIVLNTILEPNKLLMEQNHWDSKFRIKKYKEKNKYKYLKSEQERILDSLKNLKLGLSISLSLTQIFLTIESFII